MGMKSLSSSLSFYSFLFCFICILSIIINNQSFGKANAFKVDREIVNQIWKTVYAEMPDPYFPPDFEGGRREVQVATEINSVVFHQTISHLMSTVTMRYILQWETSKNVPTNEFIKRQRGILLDPNKVWHPKISISNALNTHEISKHLEVRVDGDSGKFTLIQSVSVTTHCEVNKFLFPLGNARCSLHIGQEGMAHLHPPLVWQNRRHCVVRRSSLGSLHHVHTTVAYPTKMDSESDESQLVLNICWHQNGAVLLRLLLSTICIMIIFQIVQFGCCPIHRRLPIQTLLFALLIALWNIFGNNSSITNISNNVGDSMLNSQPIDTEESLLSTTQQQQQNSISGPSVGLIDLWFAICLCYIAFGLILQLVCTPIFQRLLSASGLFHQPMRPSMFIDTPRRPLSSTQDYFQDFRPPDECLSSNCAGKCSCRYASDHSSNPHPRSHRWLHHGCITFNVIIFVIFICFSFVLWLFVYPKYNETLLGCSLQPNCIIL